MESNTEQTLPQELASTEPEKPTVVKNRKQRRFEAKLARSNKQLTLRTYANTIKATVRQMKESKRVQDLVVEGKLDKYLG